MKKNLLLLFWGALFAGGCGVKGKPLPPLEPLPMGDGRLKYQKSLQEKKNQKKAITRPPDERTPEEEPR